MTEAIPLEATIPPSSSLTRSTKSLCPRSWIAMTPIAGKNASVGLQNLKRSGGTQRRKRLEAKGNAMATAKGKRASLSEGRG